MLATALHVRRTELRRTLQVAGFAIVVGWALYTGFSGAQSIFLNKAGPNAYPLFFIVLAFCVWPMAALEGALSRRFGVGRAFRIVLGGNVIAAIATFGAYVMNESAVVAFVAYVVYSVAFELVMLSFWTFVTQHFNVLEGKRIFPVIAAGSSVGYILSGVTTTLVAVVATEPLMFVWAFGSLAAIVMSRSLERTLFRPAPIDDADELLAAHDLERKRHGAAAVMRRAIEYVTGSRLVLTLVLLALVLQVASRVGDYLVAVLFVSATHNNLQALTILIGNAWLASYVVQLVVSLFVTPWVLQRLGVRNAILVLPAFTLVGFAAVALNPVLATALFLFVVRNGLQTGLDDPSQNVLGGALPAQVVPKLRFLVDNLVLPGGAVITGAGLLVVERAGVVSVEVLALLGIATGAVFAIAAWRVRAQYLDAIYTRLRAHALNLSDFQQAIGRPASDEVAELQAYLRDTDDQAHELAAEALAKAAPDAFAAMVPELVTSSSPVVRRLAFQLAPPETITFEQLETARNDPDGSVRAAAAVAGLTRRERWGGSAPILEGLAESNDAGERAAAAWAAAFTGDESRIAAAMGDPDPRVRQEGLRSFARMKGRVDAAATPLLASMRDADLEVRREALRQAIRWSPPDDMRQAFAEVLAEGLASGDRDVRRLAAEAMAAQAPEALTLVLPLLLTRDETAVAAVEALMRSGQPKLYEHARAHLVSQLANAVQLARLAARAGEQYPFLRIGLEDYVDTAARSGIAAMRALHGKRGFATVERGLVSIHAQTRMEALETLLNFGPRWLAVPLARLLEPESFDPLLARPLTATELEALAHHEDRWVRETADAALHGLSEDMKGLIALKQVPLFSTLTLEQLTSIDRLMVTRHYVKGESVFRRGDVGGELYVIVDGEIRIHLDRDGSEVTLARQPAGSVMGEMSVFDEQPRSASAQAMTATTVRVLRRDRLQAIVHEHPEVLMEFIKNLSERLRAMDAKLESTHPEAVVTP